MMCITYNSHPETLFFDSICIHTYNLIYIFLIFPCVCNNVYIEIRCKFEQQKVIENKLFFHLLALCWPKRKKKKVVIKNCGQQNNDEKGRLWWLSCNASPILMNWRPNVHQLPSRYHPFSDRLFARRSSAESTTANAGLGLALARPKGFHFAVAGVRSQGVYFANDDDFYREIGGMKKIMLSHCGGGDNIYIHGYIYRERHVAISLYHCQGVFI